MAREHPSTDPSDKRTRTPRGSRRASTAAKRTADVPADCANKPEPLCGDGNDLAADLNYNEARTALELSLAELQASDLDIEAMTGLYKRAEAYASRCEQVLHQIEQEVLLWKGDAADAPIAPYQPSTNHD